MRLVDDCLHASSSRAESSGVLARMGAGFPAFGCATNGAKARSTDERARLPHDGDGAAWFPWCGWLLHPTTGEVRPDYGR
eukprot:1036987-Prymnesium_polylepis.1